MPQEIGNAYLTVTPKTDANFASKLEEAGSKGGSGFGTAFSVAAGNLISEGITRIAGAAAETIGTAFANYAEHEQLAGGVEKIFDQANVGQIFEDAQNAYKELNLSANQYLDSINQVGATFAQTMGDQKGYETARKGMLAIADYASGTGRNLEELNEKYKLISRSASGYQSIADQFAGILPQTSSDFLAAAQAAGVLSDEYTQLTQVPVDEYQQAVTAMLEKGVDALGLTGNTAKESTETISGSIAMLQASWQNFLTGIFDENADMNELADRLFESLGAVISNVAPRLATAFAALFGEEIGNGIVGRVGEAFENIGAKLGAIFEKYHVTEFLDSIASTLGETLLAAIDAVSSALEIVIPLAAEIGSWLLPVLEVMLHAVASAMEFIAEVINAVMPFIEMIADALGWLIDVAGQALTSIAAVSYQGGSLYSASPDYIVPGYATGGFVGAGELYRANERGGEFIWPSYEPYMSKYADALASRMGGGGTSIYVNVQARDGEDAYELGRRIGDAASYELRMQGVSA